MPAIDSGQRVHHCQVLLYNLSIFFELVAMYLCPHCKKPGISSVQKLCSVSYTPAVCTFCRRQSYLHVNTAIRALITWATLTWIFIGIALYEQMAIYMIGTIPALLLAVDKYMLRAQLHCL